MLAVSQHHPTRLLTQVTASIIKLNAMTAIVGMSMTIKEILEQALTKIKDEYGVTITHVEVDYLNTFECGGVSSFINNIEIKAEIK